MDYSKINVVHRVLERAGIPVPDSEGEAREEAYQWLLKKDFLAAHQIRINKHYSDFTRDDWKEIIDISGKDVIRSNIGAMACILRYNLDIK